MRIWQIDGYKPDFRGAMISKFLKEKNLGKFSILDVACGYGHVLDEIKKEIASPDECSSHSDVCSESRKEQ